VDEYESLPTDWIEENIEGHHANASVIANGSPVVGPARSSLLLCRPLLRYEVETTGTEGNTGGNQNRRLHERLDGARGERVDVRAEESRFDKCVSN
jgi:hypothetical protein